MCWLAGSWMLDSWHFCNQFSGLWCPWVSFGMLGASTLASWRTLGRSWDDRGTILGHWRAKGRTLWGPGLDFIDFLLILGPILRAFWVFLDQKRSFFHIYFQVAFSVAFESKFGCLGLEKQAFGMEGIAKINFRRNWISCDSRVEFSQFWVGLGPIFMAFVALETGSKIDEFSWWFWGHPRSWAACGWRAIGSFFGDSKQSRRPEKRDMRHEKWEIDPLRGSKIWKSKKFKAVIWFHSKRRSNIEDWANASQPGGPSSRGRRIHNTPLINPEFGVSKN